MHLLVDKLKWHVVKVKAVFIRREQQFDVFNARRWQHRILRCKWHFWQQQQKSSQLVRFTASLPVTQLLFWFIYIVDCSWNVMTHGNEREAKWRGNWRMEWVANTLHTTSEHGVSSITTADAHTSAASSRLNWRPRRFKWTRPFRRKTKSGFCACAITFQTQSVLVYGLLNVYEINMNVHPPVRNTKPVTKQFLGFPWNSVQLFFPKSHRLRASFVEIDTQWRHTLGRARISTRTLYISWPIWVEFGTWDRHTMPAVCRINRYSENCTLLGGCKKTFRTILHVSCLIYVQFHTDNIDKPLLMAAHFVKWTDWRYTSMLIKIQQIQQYADIYSPQNYSTCFGCHSTHYQEY